MESGSMTQPCPGYYMTKVTGGMLIQSSNHCMTAALFPLFLDCEKVQVDRMRVGNDFRAQESWWIGVR